MTSLSKKQRYAFSTLTGLLLTISFPFSGSLMPLIFIAWIPLLLVENKLSENSKSGPHVFVHAYWSFYLQFGKYLVDLEFYFCWRSFSICFQLFTHGIGLSSFSFCVNEVLQPMIFVFSYCLGCL